MSDEQARAFQALPTPQSCRVIDFESEELRSGRQLPSNPNVAHMSHER